MNRKNQLLNPTSKKLTQNNSLFGSVLIKERLHIHRRPALFIFVPFQTEGADSPPQKGTWQIFSVCAQTTAMDFSAVCLFVSEKSPFFLSFSVFSVLLSTVFSEFVQVKSFLFYAFIV